MIWDSEYWKNDLLRRRADLDRRRRQRRWTNRSFGLLEQSVMMGFYSIRKLIEAKKLTDTIVTTKVPVLRYLPEGRPITHLNWHCIDELYDLENGAKESVSLPDLCNQFIHSYVFLPLFDERDLLAGIYITSDRLREKRLLEVSVESLLLVFKLVGSDEAAGGAMVYNPEKRDYDVILCNLFTSDASLLNPEEAAANQGLGPDD